MNITVHAERLSSRLKALVESLVQDTAAAAARSQQAASTAAERQYVSRLLAEGKITRAQADLLLEALEG